MHCFAPTLAHLLRLCSVRPLWSLYSSHGPVFRSMLVVERQLPQRQQLHQEQQQREYGYVLHWPSSGESQSLGWHEFAAGAASRGGGGSDYAQPLLSGPLWIGPLHDRAHLQAVQLEASGRGWLREPPAAASVAEAGATDAAAAPPSTALASSTAPASSVAAAAAAPELPSSRKGAVGSLRMLLELMIEEAEAEAAGTAVGDGTDGDGNRSNRPGGGAGGQQAVPPWFLRMNDVARAGALERPPSRDALAAELRRRRAVPCSAMLLWVDASTVLPPPPPLLW